MFPPTPCQQPLSKRIVTVTDIAFWKEGCNRGLRASGDGGGCVNFAGAQWFSVREDWKVPGKMKTRKAEPEPEPEVVPAVPAPIVNKRRIQPRAWEVHQATHRQMPGLTEETALGSLSPYFDPDLMGQGGVGHGNVSDSYGVTVRWHQVALGITVGIPIDEWDDAIHVKSDQFIPYGNEYSATGTGGADCDVGGTCASSHWSLAERDEHMKRWNYAQCRSLLTCARDLGPAIDLRLRDGWGQVVECAKKVTPALRTMYDNLSWRGVSCEVVKLAAGGAVGWGFGHIPTGGGATAEDNDKLAACSNNDQASTFVEAMLTAASAGDENAARTDISMGNGHTLVLYGKVYPHDRLPPTDLCPA